MGTKRGIGWDLKQHRVGLTAAYVLVFSDLPSLGRIYGKFLVVESLWKVF